MLLLTLILPIFRCFGQNKPLRGKVIPEVQFGATIYDYQNVVMPSIQLAFLFPDGKYFSVGPFINGYTSLNTVSKSNSRREEYEYRPMGFRGGLNFRISTNSEHTHGFIDLVPSVGRSIQTGRVTNANLDKAWEYLGTVNLGVNFKLKSGNSFGLYTGGGLGFLKFKEINLRQDIVRVHAGFIYQSNF